MFWNTHKKKILIGAGVLLIFIIMTRGGDAPTNGGAETVSLPIVSVLTPEALASSTAVIEANGTIETLESVDLASEVSARVARVNVSLGQDVSRGQTLVVYSNADLAANLAGAEADVESAQASRKSIEAQLTAQQATVDKVTVSSQNAMSSAEAAFNTAENNLRQSTTVTDTQVVRDAYADMVPLLQSVQNSLASVLVNTDAILGVDNTFSNDSYEDFLSATNKSLLQSAAGKYTTAKVSRAAVDSALQTISTQSANTDIDAAVSTVETALEDYRVLLVALTAVLDATYPVGDLSQTQLDALYASTNADRSTIVGHTTSITNQKQAIDTAKNSFDSLQIAFDKAAQDLAATEKNAAADITAAEAQLSQIEASLELQDAQIKSAQARAASIRASLAKTIIRAPISGTVASLPATIGELMSPGQLAVRIVNTGAYQVKTFLAAEEVSAISSGNAATIAGKYDGTVSNVSPSIDPVTNKVEVLILVTSENPVLVSEQFVDVSIARTPSDDEVFTPIPLEAVRLTSSGATVFVLTSENMLEERTIEIGSVVGANIEADIRDIDLPIVTSVRGLEAGDAVKLSE